MSNKVYISNKLAKKKGAEEAAKAFEEEARRQLLWGIKKDRSETKQKVEEKSEPEPKE